MITLMAVVLVPLDTLELAVSRLVLMANSAKTANLLAFAEMEVHVTMLVVIALVVLDGLDQPVSKM